MFYSRLNALILSLMLLAIPATSHSITIDEFQGDQSIDAGDYPDSSFDGIAVPDSATPGRSSAIGGNRKVYVAGDNGSSVLKTRLSNGSGILSHSQDVTATGRSTIVWDGTVNSASTSYTGLGGVDFEQDGSDSIVIRVLSFDYPSSKSVEIELTFYTDENNYSRYTHLLDRVYSNEDITIPYADIIAATSGPSGAVDFNSIGAIRLSIIGDNDDVDLALSLIGTNECAYVPDSNLMVVDDCAVCNGDNSTCADCEGTPYGTAVNDLCGECAGDNSSCSDCKGVPFGSAVEDRCNVCEGDGSSCLECKSYDQTSTLKALDGGAKDHEKLINQINRQLANVSGNDPKILNFVKKINNKVHKLQIRNWTISWYLPRVTTQCANLEFCISTSNSPIIDEYKANSESLRKFGIKSARKLRRLAGKLTRRHKRMVKKNTTIHNNNLALADTVPLVENSCS